MAGYKTAPTKIIFYMVTNMKKILGRMRRAITDYNMIQDGDKLAVGLSGGKDSLTLLVALARLKTFLPEKFDLVAINLAMGFEGFDASGLEEVCKHYNITFVQRETYIGKIVFDIRNEKNPCSLCANLRRGALNNIAVEYGCNKVALGHHLDDTIETFFLSLFYEGRINTFSPVTYLDRKKLFVIRPMIYIPEAEIRGFIRKNGLPVVHNPCPANCHTNRQYIKDLIRDLGKDNPLIKERVFGAIQRSLPDWKV